MITSSQDTLSCFDQMLVCLLCCFRYVPRGSASFKFPYNGVLIISWIRKSNDYISCDQTHYLNLTSCSGHLYWCFHLIQSPNLSLHSPPDVVSYKHACISILWVAYARFFQRYSMSARFCSSQPVGYFYMLHSESLFEFSWETSSSTFLVITITLLFVSRNGP